MGSYNIFFIVVVVVKDKVDVLISLLVIYIFFLFSSSPSFSWGGYDWNKGSFIEIEKSTLVRDGETIQLYEYGEGYKELDIDSIKKIGSHVVIAGTDNETGEEREFEME